MFYSVGAKNAGVWHEDGWGGAEFSIRWKLVGANAPPASATYEYTTINTYSSVMIILYAKHDETHKN